MRVVYGIFLLLITYVASYPSFHERATDNDESDNNLELEIRSILNRLNEEQANEEQMTRSVSTEENNEEDSDDDDAYIFSKRQGGRNVVDKQSKCEIECIYAQRNPKTGKGKSVKEAAKVCKNLCPNPNKGKTSGKGSASKKPKNKSMNLREYIDDDNSSSSEEQQRREFYDYLLEQLQRNNN